MARPRLEQPTTGSLPGRLLEVLADRHRHSATELREALAVSRGTLGSALHSLETRYGCSIERTRFRGATSYRLSAAPGCRARMSPDVGASLVVVAASDGELTVEDSGGQRWTVAVR